MEIKPVLSRKIDLGCGPVRQEGFLRADKDSGVNPDFEIDFEKPNWPLPQDHFVMIYSSHCMEHLWDIDVFLSECSRIAVDGARFRFEFPHYSVSFIEPGHKKGLGLHALALHKEFKVEKVRLEWSPSRQNKSLFYYALDKLITRVANWKPYISERIFCYWVGGFSNVILEGEIRKGKKEE